MDYVLRATGFTRRMKALNIAVHCPTAKARPYSFAGGALSNVWFDRTDLHISAPEDTAGMDASFAVLRQLMDKLETEQGIPSSRVFLGGFSMGGGMALAALARQTKPLAGVFAIGSFLAADSDVYKQQQQRQQWSLPRLLLAHGQADMVVPYAWGEATAKKLFALSPKGGNGENGGGEGEEEKVAFYGFPRLQHEFDQRVLSVLARWIESGARHFPDVAEEQADGKVLRVALGPPSPPPPRAAGAAGGGGGGGAAAKGTSGVCTPCEIQMTLEEEIEAGGVRRHRATFRVQQDKVESFLSRPVAARGAHFSFIPGKEPDTFCLVFESPRPEETANAVLEKVRSRLADPHAPEGLSACSPS